MTKIRGVELLKNIQLHLETIVTYWNPRRGSSAFEVGETQKPTKILKTFDNFIEKLLNFAIQSLKILTNNFFFSALL